jgi:hypothetical protein
MAALSLGGGLVFLARPRRAGKAESVRLRSTHSALKRVAKRNAIWRNYGMRRFALFWCLILGLSGGLKAEQLPEMRPALIGSGPRSLVNMINTERLMKRGQKDAMIMFTCGVTNTGQGTGMVVYRGTLGSDALTDEALPSPTLGSPQPFMPIKEEIPGFTERFFTALSMASHTFGFISTKKATGSCMGMILSRHSRSLFLTGTWKANAYIRILGLATPPTS